MGKHKLNKRYRSKVNNIAVNCTYEIIKMNKTTCWVQLWEDNIKSDIVYKNIPYRILVD